MSLQRSGVLFFAPTAISDGRKLRGEKPSKQEGHPNPSHSGVCDLSPKDGTPVVVTARRPARERELVAG